MSPALQTHLCYLPVPLQRAVLQFAGLPGHDRTAERLASLVDGHLEACGMAGEAVRARWLPSALAVLRLRFGITVERRDAPRESLLDSA